jgi:uroporphyrinogen decarboxylase
MQRVVAALSHEEADRVPVILPLTLHGAKEMGLSIKDYFSKAEHVVEGQIRLMQKYHSDAYIGFLHAPLEIAAFGGEVIYVEDGPPNSGEPFLRKHDDILSMQVPDVQTNPHLRITLDAITQLKAIATDQIPIVGVVMSPFSLPVMQMGFDKYLDLIYDHRDLFWKLMEKNIEFCRAWTDAQLAAGATAIVYFDPVSSPTIIPPELYLETGFRVAQRIIPQTKGAVITHMASGRCLPILDDLIQTGTAGIGVSAEEDIAEIKGRCRGKVTLFGNLNAIEMRNWDAQTMEHKVRQLIQKAGSGGGFILMDNHGELPWQISDDTIYAIVAAVHKWGQYPIETPEQRFG